MRNLTDKITHACDNNLNRVKIVKLREENNERRLNINLFVSDMIFFYDNKFSSGKNSLYSHLTIIIHQLNSFFHLISINIFLQ